VQTTFGSTLAWILVLVGFTTVSLPFRGRIASRLDFPIARVAAAALAIHRWLWFCF